MKCCSRCGEDKSLSSFNKSKRSKDGYNGVCRECLNGPDGWYANNRETAIGRQRSRYYANQDYMRGYHLERKYGVTLEWYEETLVAQGGCCAVCGYVPEKGQRRLAVDHDHETGVVRGLLCQLCNLSVGYMKDDPILLRAAATYLESHDS